MTEISFIVFMISTYGLAFLAADAHIFGCDIQKFKEMQGFPDEHELYSIGTIRIRPVFMQLKFFRDLFSCYFCMGVWCGAFLHFPLSYLYGSQYWLQQPHTQLGTAAAILISLLVGASSCYALNLMYRQLEQ